MIRSKFLVACLVILFGFPNAFASQPTGGFWQNDSDPTFYQPLTASQIASFLPSTRSAFTFPAPYNTQGFRVTLPSDCPNSSNCVNYIGYSYWARMNNSAGSPFMYILVGLGTQGAPYGPTIYKYDKDKNTIAKVGPVFPTGSGASYNDGEQMYFSYGHPYGLYYINGLKSLQRINILTKSVTTIFNINNYNSSDLINQCSSSNDDVVHACTLENSSNTPLGCVVYDSSSAAFSFFPSAVSGGFDECHVDASGKYVLIDEKTPQTCSSCDEDTVLVDLQSGTQTVILNQNGGGGHYATGYGYYAQAMDWATNYSESMLWNAANIAAGGAPVLAIPWANMCSGSTCADVPQHPSWLNAVPATTTPIAQQYACDSASNTYTNAPFANQVYCFYLNGSTSVTNLKSLVVAPILSNPANTGCGSGNYAQQPKGNIDFTGHYFIWSANLDSNNNCQVLVVRIPTAQLPYPPPNVTPPEVSITAPTSGASVSGTITLKTKIWSNSSISKVVWKIDGQSIGSSSTSPYSYKVDTNSYSMGTHKLTATAIDASGITGTATETAVFSTGTSGGTSGGSLGILILIALGTLEGLVLMLRQRRKRKIID